MNDLKNKIALLKRIFGLGKQGIEKTLEKYEDKMYLLQNELKKYKQSRNEINNSLVEIKGMLRKTENDEVELTKLIENLDKGALKANKEGKIDLAKEAFQYRKSNQVKLETVQKNKESYREAISRIEKQLVNLDTKIRKLECKIQELKVKDQFTQSTNKLNSAIKNINSIVSDLDGNNHELVDKIETDYYVAEAKLEELDDANDLDTLLNDTDIDFEEYIKGLDKE